MVDIRGWIAMAIARFYYLLAESYRHFGNQYRLTSEYEHAIAAFTRAIAPSTGLRPRLSGAGAFLLARMDHPQRAILDLATYELDANLIEARFNQGIAYQQLHAMMRRWSISASIWKRETIHTGGSMPRRWSGS